MYLVTFSKPMKYYMQRSGGGRLCIFEPFKPYVMTEGQFDRMQHDEKSKSAIMKASHLDHRLENFNITAQRKSNNILFYNGAGGYGDQIMSWAFAHTLHKKGFNVHVATDPGNEHIWWFPWIKSTLTFPMEMALFELFENHVVFPHLTNFDEHQDQLHPADVMLKKIGIDPDTVPNSDKVVAPLIVNDDIERVNAEYIQGRNIGIYQMACSASNRSLDPDSSAFIAHRLAREFSNITWYVPTDQFIPEAYSNAMQSTPIANIKVVKFGWIRDVLTLCAMAKVVVAPDSFFLHAAGVSGTPCVGLWGLTSPATRMKYYPNHRIIHHKDSCPHAPCHYSRDGLPSFCPPPAGGGTRSVCEVMSRVSADEVVQAVRAILP